MSAVIHFEIHANDVPRAVANQGVAPEVLQVFQADPVVFFRSHKEHRLGSFQVHQLCRLHAA